MHLVALRVLEHAQEPDGQQQRRERRTVRGMLGQLGDEHETRDDDHRAAHTKEPGDDTRQESEQGDQEPRHVFLPFPQAPPPGVSTRRTSPATSRSVVFDASALPLIEFSPGAPSAPAPPPPPPGPGAPRPARPVAPPGAGASNPRVPPPPPSPSPFPPRPPPP